MLNVVAHFDVTRDACLCSAVYVPGKLQVVDHVHTQYLCHMVKT